LSVLGERKETLEIRPCVSTCATASRGRKVHQR